MVRTYSHSSLHLLLLSLKSSMMARHQGKSGVGKKPSAAKDEKTKDSHVGGGQKSKTTLIQDDPMSRVSFPTRNSHSHSLPDPMRVGNWDQIPFPAWEWD